MKKSRFCTLFFLLSSFMLINSLQAQADPYWHGWGEDLEGMEGVAPLEFDRDVYTLIGTDNEVPPTQTTGWEEMEAEFTVTVYPNPVQSKLEIDIGYTSGILGDAEVMIFSMTSQVLLEATFVPGQRMALDVDKLPVGIYMVRIAVDDNMVVRKIVKK